MKHSSSSSAPLSRSSLATSVSTPQASIHSCFPGEVVRLGSSECSLHAGLCADGEIDCRSSGGAIMHRLRRRAHAYAVRRNALAFHHHRQRSHLRELADLAVVEDGGTCSHGGAATDLDAAHFHDPILVEVSLRAAEHVEHRIITDGDAIELGQISGIDPSTFTYFGAEQPQEPGQKWRAAQVFEPYLAR